MLRLLSVRVLDDTDVEAALTPAEAVSAMRDAVIAAYRRELASPSRIQADGGDTTYVFTVGGRAGGPSGFRAYGLWPGGGDQIVAVWQPGGSLAGVVTGSALGAYRTGGLGGVAVDALAVPHASVCALIGAGAQAWAQVWAISAVRRLKEVRVVSRTAGTREALATRIRDTLGVPAHPMADPRAAVEGAEVVVTATTSRRPVLEPEWLAAGCHVTVVGAKFRDGSEVPATLVDIASVVVSDSPEQARAGGSWFSDHLPDHLGSVLTGDALGRTAPGDMTLYCSTGLAGSEIVLADRLLQGL